jgi:hypothetical protein
MKYIPFKFFFLLFFLELRDESISTRTKKTGTSRALAHMKRLLRYNFSQPGLKDHPIGMHSGAF